jgi:uncharacterized protein
MVKLSSISATRNASLNHASVLRFRAFIALLLIVPASSVGALISLFIAPGVIGQVVVVICGLWMLLFPILWTVRVDRRLLNLTRFEHKGLLTGAILGAVMFSLILGFYWFWGRSLLNPIEIRAKAQQIGLSGVIQFHMAGLYLSFINSLVEEYVWRWFVYRKCEVLMSRRNAVWVSALFFTVHHTFILLAYTQNWQVVLVGTLGVFLAGIIWSRCYQIYRSILPSYISHVAADLALHIMAWNILWG